MRYTPDPGYYGTDTFSYTATDGHGMANVKVNVLLPESSFLPMIDR